MKFFNTYSYPLILTFKTGETFFDPAGNRCPKAQIPYDLLSTPPYRILDYIIPAETVLKIPKIKSILN